MKAISGKSAMNSISNIINLCLVVAIIVVLSVESNDCDNPVRAWLITYATCVSVTSALYFLTNFLLQSKTGTGVGFAGCLGCLALLVIVFLFAWVIVGAVWVFGASECADDAPAVYYLGLVIVILNFVSWGLTMLMCVLLCCGIGIMASQASAELNEELNYN